MKLVISTSALIDRKPIDARRFCSHSGDGPFLTPRTSRKAKPGQRSASSTVSFTGQGNSPLTGLMAGSLNLPMSAAERSRAMRSEERRVGKECRCRGAADDEKKKRERAR